MRGMRDVHKQSSFRHNPYRRSVRRPSTTRTYRQDSDLQPSERMINRIARIMNTAVPEIDRPGTHQPPHTSPHLALTILGGKLIVAGNTGFLTHEDLESIW